MLHNDTVGTTNQDATLSALQPVHGGDSHEQIPAKSIKLEYIEAHAAHRRMASTTITIKIVTTNKVSQYPSSST